VDYQRAKEKAMKEGKALKDFNRGFMGRTEKSRSIVRKGGEKETKKFMKLEVGLN